MPGNASVVAGVEVKRPEKVLWPDVGITKLDYVRYLDAVADRMLPWLADRPLSLIRAPDGVERHAYMQKHAPDYTPGWIRTISIPAETSKRDKVRYYLCNDRRTLVWLGNQAALEFHPSLVRTDRPERLDALVIDVDPPPGGFDRAAEVARLARDVLAEHGVDCLLKTTGGKGVHVVVPLERRHRGDEVGAAATIVAERIVAAAPDLATTAWSKKDRGGRVYVDTSRAGLGGTLIAPYSPRARAGAPVAFPLAWDELDGASADRFTIRTVPDLLDGPGPRAWERPRRVRLPNSLTRG